MELNLVKSIFFVSCSCHVILRHTNNYSAGVLYFPHTYNYTPFYGHGTSVDPTSRVRSSTMLGLSIAVGVFNPRHAGRMLPVDWRSAACQEDQFFRSLGPIFPIVKKIQVQKGMPSG
jgi:hypothetical protein